MLSLLGFKVFRDIDKAIGRSLGKFYDWIAPNETPRKRRKYSDEQVEKYNQEFKANNPKLYKQIKEACDELGEDLPPIVARDFFGMNGNRILAVPDESSEVISSATFKKVVCHEMGHLDTNVVGLKVGNYATCFAIAMSYPTYLTNLPILNKIFCGALLVAFLVNSYNRSEEFRCDEKAVKIGDSELLTQALTNEARKDGEFAELAESLFSVIHPFIELLISHPTSWARKENLRESERELEKQNGASLA